jgi:hypothetical protein
LTKVPGGTVDADTGKLTLDASAAWEHYLKHGSLHQVIPTAEAVAAVQERYQELTGEATSDFPVVVPLEVIARDEEGSSDAARFEVIVLAPLDQATARAAELARLAGDEKGIRPGAGVPPGERVAVREPGVEDVAGGSQLLDAVKQLTEALNESKQARAAAEEALGRVTRAEERAAATEERLAMAEGLGSRAEERLADFDEQATKARASAEKAEAQLAGSTKALSEIQLRLQNLELQLATARADASASARRTLWTSAAMVAIFGLLTLALVLWLRGSGRLRTVDG